MADSQTKATFQIEATIEKLELNVGSLKIQLKGCGKYCFEKTKNEKEKEKECWNIFENLDDISKSIFKNQDDEIQIGASTVTQHLLGYAFAEKKKFKFKLKESEKNGKTIYTIAAISHVSN